jgi:uncharacterized protein YecE (DUF72 family)
VKIHVGTSGYSYKEWKGNFYPANLPAAGMLSYYAERFDTVEINNTFYRMPDQGMVAKWGSTVPETFTFVLKAPQRITHQKRLAGAEDDVKQLFDVASVLGHKLGPVLFQLPPYSKKDAGRLQSFLEWLPAGRKVAFEFRHDSWCDDEIYSILRGRDVPICLSDTDESGDPDALVIPTAKWGYLRLRRTEYSEADLAGWAKRVQKQPWDEAFIFFKHEDEGKGPAFAKKFLEVLQ